MALIKILHLLRYFHIVIDHENFAKSSFWSCPLKVLCIPQNNLGNKHFRQFLNHIMEEKEKDELGLVLQVIYLWLGNFTLISGKKDVMTSLFDLHIIFSSKYFDLDCILIWNRAPRNKSRTWSCDRSRYLSREQPAAASASFSDENYIMILFSEHRIRTQIFVVEFWAGPMFVWSILSKTQILRGIYFRKKTGTIRYISPLFSHLF